MDASQVADCTSIIKSFQKHMLSAPSEEAIIASTLPRLVSIQVNATAASSNIQSAINPPLPKELINSSFNNNTVDINAGISIPEAIGTPDTNSWKSWLANCLSCEARVDFRAELPNTIDDTLLTTVEAMAAQYLQEITFIINLFNSTDIYSDVCPLLFALQDICIPDLQRMLSLLAGILFRMTVRELQATDIISLLIQPIIQPLFLGIFAQLAQYKLLVVSPLNCVRVSINTQLDKLKLGTPVNSSVASKLTDVTGALSFNTLNNSNKEKFRSSLQKARSPLDSIDEGNNALQNSIGTATSQLDRYLAIGIGEINLILNDLQSEIGGFLGVNNKDSMQFLLNQYEKITIFRLLSFITALIKALSVGFNCDMSSPTNTTNTVDKFMNDFLNSNAPIIVNKNPNTGELQLFVNPDIKPITDSIGTDLTPSVSTEVAKTFNDIIAQSSQPVTIKPQCVFDPSSSDSNRLAQWIAELNAVGAS